MDLTIRFGADEFLFHNKSENIAYILQKQLVAQFLRRWSFNCFNWCKKWIYIKNQRAESLLAVPSTGEYRRLPGLVVVGQQQAQQMRKAFSLIWAWFDSKPPTGPQLELALLVGFIFAKAFSFLSIAGRSDSFTTSSFPCIRPLQAACCNLPVACTGRSGFVPCFVWGGPLFHHQWRIPGWLPEPPWGCRVNWAAELLANFLLVPGRLTSVIGREATHVHAPQNLGRFLEDPTML